MHSLLSINTHSSGKKWAVMRIETQDGSSDDFMRCAHRREQPTCLRSYICPCPCLTAQPVFTYHSGSGSSFRFAVAHLFFIRQVYREKRRCALTMASHFWKHRHQSNTMPCLCCPGEALILLGNLLEFGFDTGCRPAPADAYTTLGRTPHAQHRQAADHTSSARLFGCGTHGSSLVLLWCSERS